MEKVSFEEALKALLDKKCEHVLAGDDVGPIVLQKLRSQRAHSHPVLMFRDGEHPIPAHYALREFALVGVKREFVKRAVLNFYIADETGQIVGGPFRREDGPLPELKKGQRGLQLPGLIDVEVPRKKKVKKVIDGVKWAVSKRGVAVDNGPDGCIGFCPAFIPYTNKPGEFTALELSAKGKTRVTIEYEE